MRGEIQFQWLDSAGPDGLFWPHAEFWAAELLHVPGMGPELPVMTGATGVGEAVPVRRARPELQAVYCERTALAGLSGQFAGLPAAPVSLLDADASTPDTVGAWLGGGGSAPMELLILAGDAGTWPALPLSLRAPVRDGSWWIDCGRFTRPELRLAADGSVFERAILTMLTGHVGPAAAWSVLHGVQALLRHLLLAPRPLLIRLDLPGLGLGRREQRILERRLSRQIIAYSWRSGLPSLVLGEAGHVIDGGRARIDFLPRRSARVDVVLPHRRRRPSFIEIQAPALRSGRMAPLGISVTSPDGERISLRTVPGGGLAKLTDLAGHLRAFILPAAADTDERRSHTHTHVLGFAPTTSSLRHGRGCAAPSAWEVTLRNSGAEAISVNCTASESVSTLGPMPQPVPRLRASDSVKWDPGALDFVEPIFEGIPARLDQLVRRGTALPPRVLRRFVDLDDWPRATVHHGLRAYDVTIASGNPPGTCDPDPLVALCLDVLRRGAQERSDQLLAHALARPCG